MKLEKIKLSQIKPDPKNIRNDYEEIPELADSIQDNGQEQPITIEVLDKNSYLLRDGHRRYRAFEEIKKRTKKDPLVQCYIAESTLTDKERLITRCRIDAQTKTLSVLERENAWAKVWEDGGFELTKEDKTRFRKLIGTSSTTTREFFDRKELLENKDINKLYTNEIISAGVITESNKGGISKENRIKILKHAGKNKISPMGVRAEMVVLKDASDKLIDAFTKNELTLEEVEKFKTIKESKHEEAIETMVQVKHKVKETSDWVAKNKTESEQVTESGKTVGEVMKEIQTNIVDTNRQMENLDAMIDDINDYEEDFDKFFPEKVKSSISELFVELQTTMQNTNEKIEKLAKKWR